MNTKKISFLLTVGSLIIAACNNPPTPTMSPEAKEEQMHREHTNLADNLAHKKIIVLEEQFKGPQEFSQQVNILFENYLGLEDALVKGDTVAANNAAIKMKSLLDETPEPSTDEKATEAWNNHKQGYQKNLTEFLHVNGLQEKRSYFSHISEILYCTLKSFETETDNIHVAFCPMAFDNKGAYWLTDSPEIKNPYFGDKMLKCGKIEEVIPKGNL